MEGSDRIRLQFFTRVAGSVKPVRETHTYRKRYSSHSQVALNYLLFLFFSLLFCVSDEDSH